MSRLLLLILFTLSAARAFSQEHTEEFQLSQSEKKVSGSLYSNLQLLDLRPDTTDVGTIQTGALNRQTRLVPVPALRQQLPALLKEMAEGGTAPSGTLLLRLGQFRISELTSGLTETGYCALQADLLVNTGEQHQMLARIDTLLEVRGGLDITKSTLRKANCALLYFISSNLTKTAAGNPALTWAEVLNLDSVEKRSIPLYNLTNGYTNGLYNSYEAFAAQRPTIQVTAEVGTGKIYKVRTFYPAGGKGDKVKPGQAYAIVHEGIPYMGTDYGFYKLYKRGDDFLFIGRIKVTAQNRGVFIGSLAFGLLGGIVAALASPGPSNTPEFYKLKIDHRSGRPVFMGAVR